MKKLIPNISKMAMGGEPPRKTIYVSDKNSPRLKSYQDSLALYNISPPPLKGTKTKPYDWRVALKHTDNYKNGLRISVPLTESTRPKIEPIGSYAINGYYNTMLKGQVATHKGLYFYKIQQDSLRLVNF